jgi:hypothetical protein
MTVLAFFGGALSKKFFHRNTVPFSFGFGDNAVSRSKYPVSSSLI